MWLGYADLLDYRHISRRMKTSSLFPKSKTDFSDLKDV
jgi:hypothetical protein